MDAPTLSRQLIDTPIGLLLLAATDRGLVKVGFHAKPGDAPGDPGAATGGTESSRRHIAAAEHQVMAYFAGELREFDVPLDWSLSPGTRGRPESGTFNRRVLEELAAQVPYGTVVSYQFLADRVGEPGAAQAVGRAMASNPIPVVVPCHRVIESDGGLGGFGGGLDTKRKLLALEGVLPEPLF